MDLSERFQQHWKQQFPHLSTGNCHLLLAVSGGADSVVLTDLVVKAGFSCALAHCNFQLRGEESERDEQFVRSLGEKYGVKVWVQKFDTFQYAAEHKVSVELAARELRYTWFAKINQEQLNNISSEESIIPLGSNTPLGGITLSDENTTLLYKDVPPASEHSLPPKGTMGISGIHPIEEEERAAPLPVRLIVTAHHADDNIETMLMNFFRGTGIQGLRGILPLQKELHLIRPLLVFRKEELVNYAIGNGLSFVEDSSNVSVKYTRNYFRHRIIPSLKEVYSQVEENMLKNLERFAEAEELYQQAIQLHKKRLLEQQGNETHISVLKLLKSSPLQTIVWEIIKEFNFSAAQTGEVIKLTGADSGSYVQSATHRVIKNRNWLLITPLQSEGTRHILVEAGEKKIVFDNGVLQIENIPASKVQITADPSVAFLNADILQFPLLLRRWKQGDYFYPLGMQKKKKLSRFFIDLKLSKTAKENVWVVEMNKKIVWVIGHRIDDRFKFTTSTKNVLKISYLK